MNTSKLIRTILKKPGLRYAAQAATKEAPLTPTGIEVSQLPNGVVVASVDNLAPVARVAVAFKASARNENEDNLGVSHCLRVLSDQSSQTNTSFGLVRELQQAGATMTANSTREMTIYGLECLRDLVGSVQDAFASAASLPAFKPWEVSDFQQRIALDLGLFQGNTEAVLFEALHSAAFKTTLGRSIYAPGYMIGKYNADMLQDFVVNNMTSGRCAVVGVGVDHSQAVELARLLQMPNGHGAQQQAAAYVGGETRIQNSNNVVSVALAVEGASTSSKEAVAFAVLQLALGTGPPTKYGSCQGSVPTAVSAAAQNPFAVTGFNCSYSDSGLFGVSVMCTADDAGNVVKAAHDAMKNASKTVADKDIKRAKALLKSQLLFSEENSDSRVLNMAARALLTDPKSAALTTDQLAAQVDAVESADVQAVAKRLGGALSMAAVGNLKNVPYLHQLS